MTDSLIPPYQDIKRGAVTKNELDKINTKLTFWLGYIEYRSKQNWRGQDSSYIETDLQNILIRMRNDLITNESPF
jgi:hypothetical protein